MAWYRTGTLTVTSNSKTITGVGTQWANAAQGIGAGQMLLLVPGDGTITAYEIASVDSNTKITLVNNYTAASGSGKSYAIVNTYVDSVPDFARRLAAQIAYYQSQIEGINNLYTATGNVTLTAPDGTVVTVPSYNKMTTDMTTSVNNVLDMTQFRIRGTTGTGNGNPWRLLGTFSAGQNGESIKISFGGGAAFSGGAANAGPQELAIRTGNSPAGGTNSRGRCAANLLNQFATSGAILDVRIIESSSNKYDIYVKLGSYTISTYYSVSAKSPANAISMWEDKQTDWVGDGDVGPVSVMDIKKLVSINYDVDNGDVASSYQVASRPAINGFGGNQGQRILGDSASSAVNLMNELRNGRGTQVFRTGSPGSGLPGDGPSIHIQSSDVSAVFSVNYAGGNVVVLSTNTLRLRDGIVSTNLLYGTANTTVDANGFIKKASPIVRLSNGNQEMGEDFLSDQFMLSGCAAINEEAQTSFAKRISVGVYEISGSLGFAKEGWTIEVPQDVNGNRLCFVEAAFDSATGLITVKVFKRKFDVDTAMIVAGAPMDIPDGRWIDLRLDVEQPPEPEYVPPEDEGESESE